ncbi:MAG TPA: hypothetical protein RMF84_06240, partial [Polyangiaceae bacterium LLY-WYZ-14_1]|nr:hypothetical protein [Polyangiaceae bacterium LLY-WYZ-14_1]
MRTSFERQVPGLIATVSSVCCTACSLWLPYDLPEEDCFTSADEDGDGFGRCVDLDCDGSCDETITNGICGDLRDNDGDGLTDILDPGCWRSSIQTCGSVEGTSLSAVATEDPQSWRGPVAAAPPDGVRRPLRSVIPGEPLVLFERLFGQLRGTRLALDVLLRTGASVEVALMAALEEQTRPPTFRVRLDGDGSVELEIAQAALVRRTDLDGVAFFAPGDWTRIELEIVEESGSGFAVVRVDGSEARRLPFDAFLVGTTSGYDLSLRSGWPPEASAPLFAGLEVERPSD